MSTLFYDARKDRGISNLTSFSMEMAGDVGYELTGTVVGDPIAHGAELTLLLDGGQAKTFIVETSTPARSGNGGTDYRFTAYEEGAAAFKKSLKLTRHYLTLTEEEWRGSGGHKGFAERLAERGERDDYKYHIKFGDEFGRKGWKTGDIIRQIAAYVGLDDVVYGVKDFWVRDAMLPLGMSGLRIVLELVSILDPLVFVKDNVLMILPRQAASDAEGALVVGKTLAYDRPETQEYAPDATVHSTGGTGILRLDKWKGDTYSGFSYPGYYWKSLRKGSRKVRNIIDSIKWQGEVEVEQNETESDTLNERRVVQRYWLHSVTGGRHVLLATRALVYNTSGFFDELKRLEETIHEFEGLNWSCQAPRLTKTTQIISGYGWGIGVDTWTFFRRWYSPLSMTVTEFTWSSVEVGVQESELKTVSAVLGTFEEAPAAGEEDTRSWLKVSTSEMKEEQAQSLMEIRSDVDDAESTLVEEVETKYVPISPYMYSVEAHVMTMVPQKNERIDKHSIALSEVPQEPLAARGMGLYYEEGVGGEEAQDTPGVESSAPMIVDWEDMDDHGIEAAKERGTQYTANITVPGGAIVIERGTPIKIDGMILGECEGVSISQKADSGVESVIHVKQRQVA